jgi:hypothetical protein
LPLIELSVVPVASKNTTNGEIPVSRTALAFSVREPLVPEQDKPVGTGGDGEDALTATVADWVALPPVPVQFNVKVLVAVTAPVDCEPLVATDPLQAPEAVQDVALVEDQVKVELPPLDTVLGFALIATVGAGATDALTVMVADWAALPPAPVHVNIYCAVALSGPVDCEPLVAIDPLQAPEAVQAVVFFEFQASVAD